MPGAALQPAPGIQLFGCLAFGKVSRLYMGIWTSVCPGMCGWSLLYGV